MQAESARFLAGTRDRSASLDFEALIRALDATAEHRGALAHWETLPARPARYGAT